MRIIRDIGHVKRQKRQARWAAFFGFLFLVGTFPLVFLWGSQPNLILFSYLLLFTGFVMFNYGMQQIGKWSNTQRHPRADLALDSALKGLPDKYVLIHYAKVGKKVVEHMLIHPGGILVITTRDYPGKVKARGNRWRRAGLGLTRLFGMSGPQLGNPSLETDQAIAAVEKALEEAELDVVVDGAIVFLVRTVELDVEDPDYAVMLLDHLEGFVRGLEPDESLTAPKREALIALLGKGEELEQPQSRYARRPVKVKRRVAERARSDGRAA
ncbi:MAG TPA: nuclease-related domain-containing protein [Thermomicrobiales bacterium]